MSAEVTILCRFLGDSTEKAEHVADLDDGQCYWIPVSQVTRIVRNPPDQKTGSITMTAWIAEQKGII